jgi:large subunit ribosomal protein L14
MIQKNSILNVVDNSGAKKVKCIHVYCGYQKRYANTGDLIKVAVQNLRKTKTAKVKKGQVVKALIVSCLKGISSFSGYSMKMDRNNVVLLKDKNKFVGTRLFVPVFSSFRFTKFLRLLALSRGNIK